jgi:hypothetical protein
METFTATWKTQIGCECECEGIVHFFHGAILLPYTP